MRLSLVFVFLTYSFVCISNTLFDKGLEAYDNNDYETAINFYSQFIKQNQSANAYLNRGLTHYQLKNYASAIEDFTLVIDKDNIDYEAWHYRALAYYHSKETKKAFYDSQMAIKLFPEYGNAYNTLGLCYYDWNKLDLALDAQNKSILHNETANKYYNRALTFQKMERFKDSEKDFNKAIALDSNTKYFNGLAELFYNQKNYDEAIKNYDEAINIDSNSTSLFFNRGLVYYAQYQDDVAIKNFNTALKIDSNNIDSKWYLVLSNYSAKNYEDAFFWYKKVESQEPKYSELININKTELENKAKVSKYLIYIIGLGLLFLIALFLFYKLYERTNIHS